LSACDRISCSLIKKKQGRSLSEAEVWLLSQPPDFLKSTLGDKSRLLSFTTPTPEGVEYVGRNHPLVEGLARYILEDALSHTTEPIAARCGFTTTNAVQKRTTLLLVRLRHLLDSSKRTTETRNSTSLLAEECAVIGFTGSPSSPSWLSQLEATSLLQQAKPVSDVGKAIKQVEIADLLQRLEELQPDLEKFARERAEELLQSHRRVRAMTQEGRIRVTPQLPMDVLGIFILQPGRK
jgi:hypothetical protein